MCFSDQVFLQKIVNNCEYYRIFAVPGAMSLVNWVFSPGAVELNVLYRVFSDAYSLQTYSLQGIEAALNISYSLFAI